MEPASDKNINICSDLITKDLPKDLPSDIRVAHGIAAVLSSACVVSY